MQSFSLSYQTGIERVDKYATSRSTNDLSVLACEMKTLPIVAMTSVSKRPATLRAALKAKKQVNEPTKCRHLGLLLPDGKRACDIVTLYLNLGVG